MVSGEIPVREPVLTGCAVLYRVSTDRQDSENQVPECEQFMAARGLTCVKTYRVSDSAWKNGDGGAEYQATMRQLRADAHAGLFRVFVVWALDRVIRNGAEEALRLNRELRERGCTLMSVKEDWLNTTSEIQDVLLAFAGWQAERESARRSDRVKAGNARRAAAGLPLGRQPGSRDKTPRKRSVAVRREEQHREEGYWTPERRAAAAEAGRRGAEKRWERAG